MSSKTVWKDYLPPGIKQHLFNHRQTSPTPKPPVLTKNDFVRRYGEGEFGNRSPTWDSVERFFATDYYKRMMEGGSPRASTALYHLRNRVVGGPTIYDVPITDLYWRYRKMIADGTLEQSIYVSEMCPTHLTQIQGEVFQRYDGLYLYYSSVKKPMRDSLREGAREARGLVAKTILEHYMDGNSYEWLNLLLDRYPDHVVEFTTLSREWGAVPGYNTLFWECRLY